MAAKLPIWDQRMLQLMEFALVNKIKCTTQTEFCKIFQLDSATISQIRSGKSSFRHKHILKAWQKFGVSPNFFYGLTDSMFEKPVKSNAVLMIKDAIRILESK